MDGLDIVNVNRVRSEMMAFWLCVCAGIIMMLNAFDVHHIMPSYWIENPVTSILMIYLPLSIFPLFDYLTVTRPEAKSHGKNMWRADRNFLLYIIEDIPFLLFFMYTASTICTFLEDQLPSYQVARLSIESIAIPVAMVGTGKGAVKSFLWVRELQKDSPAEGIDKISTPIDGI